MQIILIIYVYRDLFKDVSEEAFIREAKRCTCEAMKIPEDDAIIILEMFDEDNSNTNVKHCLFPILYTLSGTSYSKIKRLGELLNKNLCAFFDKDKIGHCYLHVKEHDPQNISCDGKLAD